MFSFPIGKEYKYDLNDPKFRVSFEFLKRKDLASLQPGSVDLGQGVKANIQHYTTFGWDENLFESHEKFFDIQFLIEGSEIVGVCSREGLEIAKPYNPDSDVTFYKDPAEYGKVLLKGGDFIVLAPEDVHKPRCLSLEKMPVKKIVIKVPV